MTLSISKTAGNKIPAFFIEYYIDKNYIKYIK